MYSAKEVEYSCIRQFYRPHVSTHAGKYDFQVVYTCTHGLMTCRRLSAVTGASV